MLIVRNLSKLFLNFNNYFYFSKTLVTKYLFYIIYIRNMVLFLEL